MSRHWGVALILVLLLAGCTSENKGTGENKVTGGVPTSFETSSSTAAGEAANLTDPCSLLSNDAVGEVFSIRKVTSAAKPPETASNGLLTHVCEYRAEVTSTSLGVLLVTATDGSVTPAQVAEEWLRLPRAKQVGGVGDAAVYSVDEQKKVAMLAAAKPANGKTVAVIFTSSPRATQEMLSSLVSGAIDGI